MTKSDRILNVMQDIIYGVCCFIVGSVAGLAISLELLFLFTGN